MARAISCISSLIGTGTEAVTRGKVELLQVETSCDQAESTLQLFTIAMAKHFLVALWTICMVDENSNNNGDPWNWCVVSMPRPERPF
jgi:hypothetical protein